MLRELKVLKSHGSQFIKDLRRQTVSEGFRGRPLISADIQPSEIMIVSELCPTDAINRNTGAIDIGKCMFCNECAFAVPGKIKFSNDYRIASNRRAHLIITPGTEELIRLDEECIRKEIRQIFHGALKLREVSAGGDNSCEMELAATGNVNFDMGRYGIEFVASPRHADGIVITGPVSANMAEPLRICYDAVPAPKIIVLAGTEAISGAMFADSPAINRKFIEGNRIDLYVPGNPIHPLTFINGILDLLGIK